ncbi:MAG TPA: serine/threonine-protein kinase [Acidiferrobacter sp.]|nr:serine/threonine-protein kinase [Acidiferrobacter sp.]
MVGFRLLLGQMRNAPTPLAKGYLLKGYRIEKTLGGGGFSSVYLATDLETETEVVIKEFLPVTQAYRTPEGRVEPLSEETTPLFISGIKRFFEEAGALSKLHHPNIVQVTNFFRAHNTVYMVMRHELGKDLRWYIKRHPRGLSEKFLRTVFPPLLVGLDVLHKHGLLHLDIKPANILLRTGGNPLLLDFGAAQRLQDRPPGMRTLTAGFAPIEQHSKGHIGPWTDLYAIGASMWACLSGRAPPAATARAVKDTFKGAYRPYGRRYSPQILEAIDWCMQMNQLERPQNVGQLLAFLDEKPVVASDGGREGERWFEKWSWWRLRRL